MKIRNFIALFLMVSVILSTSLVWAQDTTPPELVSIDVSPTSIDVSTGPADITVTVHLTDDLSGVATWSTTFSSPSGTQSLQIGASPGLVGGTSTDGTFEGTNTLPQGSEEGPWVAVIVTVMDVEGNSQDIDLSAYGVFLIQVGTTVTDLTPPDVFEAEVSVTPTLLDLTSGDGTATVQAHLTDDLSGVAWFHASFVSPSGIHRTWFSGNSPVSGDRLDGTFEAEAFFPQFSEPGVWRPQMCYESIPDPPGYREFPCIFVRDHVGNSDYIDLRGGGFPLQIGVISVPPELIFAIEPFSALNTINTSHTLTVTLSQDSLPIQEVEVKFEVIQGPHSGVSGSALTDGNGQASFTYTGTAVGVDTIIASVDKDHDGEVDAARQATKEWEEVSIIEVQVDIKPGSDPNSINPRSKGKIPVAILSTFDFDASAKVRIDSLTFGPLGNEESLAFCNSSLEDVNDDGYYDLVCHFYTQMTKFACGDEEGILMGLTVDEIPIEGSDSVRIVPSACPKKNK